MRTLAGLLALIALSVALTLLAERLPEPRPASAPATEFSAERAMGTLRGLTGLGVRVAGTPAARGAALRLADELKGIEGLEVQVVEASGARQFTNTVFPYPIFAYRIINVLARLPGERRDAVLLNAHFDTTGTSVGAGDDAFGVAAIVETMRALASGPTPPRSVIALLNGGEEYGLRGAEAFTRHPWAADVRAYYYIDGMAQGRPRLLNATAGHPELTAAFLDAAPRPSANIVMQEIFEGQSFGADGDHRPLQEAGLAGLSVAATDDLASAHTSRDSADRVSLPSLQDMGDTTLAVTRALAEAPEVPAVSGPRDVYFDVFGLGVVRYGRSTSAGLALVALALAVGAAVAARRQTGAPVLRSLGWLALSLGVGLGIALMTGMLLAFALGRPHGWYTAPWLTLTFPAGALSAALGVTALGLRRRAGDAAAPWGAWAAAVLGWAGALALATAAQVGAAYLGLIWTISLAAGLLAALRWPRWRAALAVLSLAPGLFALANLAIPAITAMIPMIVSMPVPFPTDPVVAVLVTLPVLAAAPGALVAAQLAGPLRPMARVCAALATVGVVVLTSRAPFDAAHPRRLTATHVEIDGKSAIALGAWDALPLEADLAGVKGLQPASPGWHPNLPPLGDPLYEVPAEVPDFPAPSAVVLSSTPGPDGARTVELSLLATTPHLNVLIPRDRLLGWSLSEALPEVPAGGDRDIILFSGHRPDGEPLTLRIRGEAPLEIELRASAPVQDAALDALLDQLPDHVVLWPEVARVARVSI